MNVTKDTLQYGRMLVEADAIPASESTLLPEVHPNTGRPTGALVSGATAMAEVDIARLALASKLATYAAAVRRDATDPELGVGREELAAAERVAERAAGLRATVSGFRKDREDRRRGRGRFRPLSVHGPARAFASAVELSPADWCECTGCGMRRDLSSDGQVHGSYRLSKKSKRIACGGTFKRGWEAPATSERFAMAQARENGRKLAAESGSAVEYVRRVDPDTGLYLGTEAVAGVGIEPVLMAELALRPSKLPGTGEAAERQLRSYERVAERRADDRDVAAWAERRTLALIRTDKRQSGRTSGRGRRAGARHEPAVRV